MFPLDLSFYYPGGAHQEEYSRMLAHGIDPTAEIVCSNEALNVVTWGWRMGRRLRSNGKNVLVMERGYLGDREEWTSLGWNGLNGNARFNNDDVPDDRWVKYWKNGMKPWRGDSGDYVIFCGQVLSDMSLMDCGTNADEYPYFVQDQLYRLRMTYGRTLFRPHPLMYKNIKNRINVPDGVEIIDPSQSTLAQDMEKARLVVAWNSNSLVEALYNGVPFVSHSQGSMVHNYQNEDAFKEPDRETWGRRISYCQWSKEELMNGTAWRFVKTGLVA